MTDTAIPDPWAETPKWLIPSPDADDREFWEGAGRGELRIQHCNDCGLYQHYAAHPVLPLRVVEHRVGDREWRRHGPLVHGHPPERCAAIP